MKQCPYEILREMKLKEYKADAFVLNQGEVQDTMYLIVDGEADIYVESQAEESKGKILLTFYRI